MQDSNKNGEENGDEEFDHSRQNGHMDSPRSDNSQKELEEMMNVEAQACIVHALSAVSVPQGAPTSPPPLAATAPHAADPEWKAGHTRLSPKLRHAPY